MTDHTAPRRRFRSRKLKAGVLEAYYGKLPHDNPDLIFASGEGTSGADRHLLYGALTVEEIHEGRSLVAELERRGYDITTLEFRIRRRVEDATGGGRP